MPNTKVMNQNAESTNYTIHAETVIRKDKRMQDKGKREQEQQDLYWLTLPQELRPVSLPLKQRNSLKNTVQPIKIC